MPRRIHQDGKPGETADRRGGGERSAVVGADRVGQAVGAKDALEILLRRNRRGRQLRPAAEQVSAEAVGHGQRVAVDAVAGLELALEVGRPELVRAGALGCGPAGVRQVAPPAPVLDQTQAFENVTGGAGRRKPQAGLSLRQPQDQLAGTPVGVLVSSLDQRFHDFRIGPMRAMPRRPTSVLKTRHSIPPAPPDPLVPRHPADPVSLAQLRHREQLALRIQHEPHSLPHLRRFAPGHPSTVPSPLQRPAPWAQRTQWRLEGLTAKAYRATRGIQLIQQSRAEPAAAADSLRSATPAAEPQAGRRPKSPPTGGGSVRAVAKRVALFVAAAAAGLSFTWLSMISDAAEAMAWPGILIDHVLNPVEPGTIRKDPD